MQGKLDKAAVLALQDGQRVLVRLSRAGRTGWETEYEGRATLYVQRHNGVAVGLTVRDRGWAEADPRRDVETDGSIIVEDYQLEVFERP